MLKFCVFLFSRRAQVLIANKVLSDVGITFSYFCRAAMDRGPKTYHNCINVDNELKRTVSTADRANNHAIFM